MIDLTKLQEAVRYEGGLSRRLMLAYGASLASLPFLGRSASAQEKPKFSSNPFTLGVASGDPDPRSVVIWTRLAPEPTVPYGGMPPVAVQVKWQIAEDQAMSKIVSSGVATATPQLGHSVHVEVKDLRPDRWYWYRFMAGDATSPMGRTRTMPRPNSLPEQLKFAVTSCQSFEAGLFTGYEQMKADQPDLVFHLGDYIYEYESGRLGDVRTHIGPEIESINDYRVRYSQYRGDPLLHEMHAACPWFVTWDDHEFDNNFANGVSEEADVDPVAFLKRRANAAQVYYEMMPFRRQALPKGPNMQIFRKAAFGRLAEFMVLDTRQYRTDQPNNDRRSPLNKAALSRKNSLLGARQRNWLYNALLGSKGTWNVLAQQVMMGLVSRKNSDGTPAYSMDQWPGYANERADLMRFLQDRRVPNPVVLTGDIHSNWANELRVDDRKPEQPLVATEFVATSLSSGGNGPKQLRHLDELMSANPCVKYHDQQRGYIRCSLTPNTWTSDYMIVDDVLKPGGKTTAEATMVVEAGNPAINASVS
jgi:alkaline phosphatase D